MQLQPLRSHLTTSNVYVQRQIVRDNIAKLKNFKSHPSFVNKPYELKRDIQKQLDAQIVLIVKIDKKIAKSEQTSFPFGGFASTN